MVVDELHVRFRIGVVADDGGEGEHEQDGGQEVRTPVADLADNRSLRQFHAAQGFVRRA